ETSCESVVTSRAVRAARLRFVRLRRDPIRLGRATAGGVDEEDDRRAEEREIDVRGDDERHLARVPEPVAELRDDAERHDVVRVEVVAPATEEEARRDPRLDAESLAAESSVGTRG